MNLEKKPFKNFINAKEEGVLLSSLLSLLHRSATATAYCA